MADRYALTWTDPTGEKWNITNHGWIAGIRAGGVEGLVGTPEELTETSPAWPGQIVTSRQIPAMVGTLRFAVRGSDRESADEIWARLRRSFHHKTPGQLAVETASSETWTANIRRSGMIPPPQVDPQSQEVILGADVPVIADEGCWWSRFESRTGTVPVSNSGDVDIWVQITWQGAGGTVVLPSGAQFVLPPTAGVRTVLLSQAESMAVVDAAGNLDDALWRELRGVALAEMVPAGEVRTWTVPEGARVQWRTGVMDPWR